MTFGFEHPLALLLIVPLLFLAVWFCRREEKNFLVHPLADHLRARYGSGSFRSHISFLLLAVAAFLMLLVAAGIWRGTQEIVQSEKARLVGVLVDVSGSMWGEPLAAAVRIVQHLIEKRADDRINVAFFASESAATPFGIPPSYLAPERVKRLADALGGDTVATHGLFREFYTIAREEGFLTETELRDIHRRASSGGGGESEMRQRTEGLKTYLGLLLEQKKASVTGDRLVVFVSDCDLSFSSYDITSVMALYEAFDIRIEVICIGTTDLEGKSDEYNRAFVEGVKSVGGHITNVGLAGGVISRGSGAGGSPSATSSESLEETLRDVVMRIESLKPREVGRTVILEKKSFAKECLLAALCFMALGCTLALFRRFRIIS